MTPIKLPNVGRHSGNKWIDTFLDEKGIDGEQTVTVSMRLCSRAGRFFHQWRALDMPPALATDQKTTADTRRTAPAAKSARPGQIDLIPKASAGFLGLQRVGGRPGWKPLPTAQPPSPKRLCGHVHNTNEN